MKKIFIILGLVGFIYLPTVAQVQTGILNINQVNAQYMNRGQMFWDGIAQAQYEVPKYSGKTVSFASGFWFSAKKPLASGADTLSVAAVTYNNKNGNSVYDFFSGPLKTNGTTDASYAGNFNKIWVITKYDIIRHLENYQTEGYEMDEDIASWPAHGDTTMGYAKYLAPFVDANNNGIYEPMQGDYPCIKGDMSLYWIFNDNLAPHTETGGNPLKIEVHVQAYAFNCDTCSGEDGAINNTTFLNWKVFNRSENDYTNFTSSYFNDADLGYAFDDYVGTHVGLNSVYTYNGHEQDGIGNGNEYGANPPAFLLTILDGPIAPLADGIDNNNNGVVDEDGEKILLSSSIYFSNEDSIQGDPVLPMDYYNYMNGYWRDARSLVFGGTGYVSEGGTPCKYMFPGDSDPWFNGTMGIDPNYPFEGGWTEENENNEPGDRRVLASIGGADLPSGGMLEYTMALVWSRGSNGAYSSVEKGFEDVQHITDLYRNTDMHTCAQIITGIDDVESEHQMSIYPNPSSGLVYVKGVKGDATCKIYTIDGALVKEVKYSNKPININALDKGIYILEIQSEQIKQQFKLMKE